jgi:hypothetical protein
MCPEGEDDAAALVAAADDADAEAVAVITAGDDAGGVTAMADAADAEAVAVITSRED